VEQLVVDVLVREGRPVESAANPPAVEQPPPAAAPATEDRSSRDARPSLEELDRAFERYAMKENQESLTVGVQPLGCGNVRLKPVLQPDS
jgi:hypothetical protein